MRLILTAVLALVLTGCASVGRERAVDAHLADLGSTAVGLALGAVEANPLGLLVLPFKAWQMSEIAKEPEPMVRAEAYMKVAAVTQGVTANNLCVVASLIIPPLAVLGPLCPLFGVAWGAKELSYSDEQLYAAVCEEWKKEKPDNVCSPYKGPT